MKEIHLDSGGEGRTEIEDRQLPSFPCSAKELQSRTSSSSWHVYLMTMRHPGEAHPKAGALGAGAQGVGVQPATGRWRSPRPCSPGDTWWPYSQKTGGAPLNPQRDTGLRPW